MNKISDIRGLVGLWPTRATLAADLQSVAPLLEVTTSRVHKWAETDTIPAKYHFAVLAAAKERGFHVSADLIVALHAPKHVVKLGAA